MSEEHHRSSICDRSKELSKLSPQELLAYIAALMESMLTNQVLQGLDINNILSRMDNTFDVDVISPVEVFGSVSID